MKNLLVGVLITVIIFVLIGGHFERNKRHFVFKEVQMSMKIMVPKDLFTPELQKKVDEMGKKFVQGVQKVVRDHISSGD